MAKFKIKLLTSLLNDTNITTGQGSFLETPVGEFDSTISDIFSYTYGEQFSIHENSQKELSFSMLDYVWVDDIYDKNPFVNKIHIGTQLLLIDTYDNEHFFTVKNIQYNLKSNNIEYTYSCQDSFSYQLTRQRIGFSIENDPSGENFLGAHNVDWWISKKIIPECYISYLYVPLEMGIYENVFGNFITYSPGDSLSNVKQIIKQPFNKDNTEDMELFSSFSFSIGDSNALSSLITLAEQLGLSIKTAERNIKTEDDDLTRTIFYKMFLWLEPRYSTSTTNIKYSPKTDLQTLSLSQNGESISTIMNVESTVFQDEVVSLIPDVPDFFIKAINDHSFWSSSSFSDNWFSALCDGQSFSNKAQNENYKFSITSELRNKPLFKEANGIWEWGFLIDDEDESSKISFYTKDYLYLAISNLNVPNLYSYLTFDDSYIVVDGEPDWITPATRKWYLTAATISDDKKSAIEKDYDNFTQLEEIVLDSNIRLFIKIYYPNTKSTIENSDISAANLGIASSNISIRFYRPKSDEEVEFAYIADKCPWLESKLIDFSYFVTQKVISKKEYSEIWDALVNDLRIINGQLLVYSKLYYNAVQDKVDILSKLQEKIDLLLAEFNASVVKSIQESGTVKDLKTLEQKYDAFLMAYGKSEKKELLNLPELLSEYATNYYKSEQRFLKNIYNFRNYFNSQSSYANSSIYTYTLSMTPPTRGDGDMFCYLSFIPNKWVKIDSTFDQFDEASGEVSFEIFDKTLRIPTNIVHANNYKNFFIPATPTPSNAYVKQKHGSIYQEDTQYYMALFKQDSPVSQNKNLRDIKKSECTKLATTDEYINLSGEKQIVGDKNIYISQSFDIDPYAPIYLAVNAEEGIPPFYFVDKNGSIVTFKDGESTSVLPINMEGKWGNNQFIYCNVPENAKQIIVQVTFDRTGTYPQWSINGFAHVVLIETEIKETETGENEKIDYYYYEVEGLSAETVKSITTWYTPVYKSVSKDIIYNHALAKRELKGEAFVERIQRLPKIETGSEHNWLNGLGNSSVLTSKAFLNSFTTEELNDEAMINIFKNGATDDQKWDFYKKHFPVTQLTYVGPCVKNQESKKTDILTFNFEYVNLKNETTEDYIAYWKGESAKTDEVINPHDPSQWRRETIKLVTPQNESEFFRRVYKLCSNSLADINSDNKWETTGQCIKDFYGSDLSTPFFKYQDSDSVVYATNTTSYETYASFPQCDHSFQDSFGVMNQYIEVDLTEENNSGSYTYVPVATNDEKTLYSKCRKLSISDNSQFYSNFYSLVGLTYSCVKPPIVGYFEYQDVFLRPIARTEIINPKDSYRILVCDKTEGTVFTSWSDYSDLSNKTLSCVKDYLITNHTIPIEFNQEDKTISVAQALGTIGFSSISSGQSNVLTGQYNGEGITFILYREENFITNKLSGDTSNGVIRPSYKYSSLSVYTSSGELFEDKVGNEAVEDFYILNQEEAVFTHPSGSWNNQEAYYQLNNSGSYSRVYSIQQIMNIGTYYYRESSSWNYETLDANKTSFSVKVCGHKETYDNGVLVKHETIDFLEPVSLSHSAVGSVFTIKIEHESNTYQGTSKLSQKQSTEIGKISNGEFYFKYKDSTVQTLQEESALIAMQLSEYWLQAYNASKFCSYFLPETWVSNQTESNMFSDWLFNITDSNISLKNTLLPNVIISEFETYSYNISHKNVKTEFENDGDSIIAPYGLYEQTLSKLNANPEDYLLVKTIKNNQYRSTGGGTLWCNLAKTAKYSAKQFSSLDGKYAMFFKTLNSNYINKTIQSYDSLQTEKQNFWIKMYIKYPNIFLEENYKSEDATTSQELYFLASQAFKDKSQPELAYQITYINLDSLQGYYSTELKIGDGILLDVEDFYEEKDDVSKALSQYLFITDISYNLRSDADVQLTVNKIKYQDKLIRRLAKLIK